jgi:hypothetical protein
MKNAAGVAPRCWRVAGPGAARNPGGRIAPRRALAWSASSSPAAPGAAPGRVGQSGAGEMRSGACRPLNRADWLRSWEVPGAGDSPDLPAWNTPGAVGPPGPRAVGSVPGVGDGLVPGAASAERLVTHEREAVPSPRRCPADAAAIPEAPPLPRSSCKAASRRGAAHARQRPGRRPRRSSTPGGDPPGPGREARAGGGWSRSPR